MQLKSSDIRIGLQTKAVVILAFMVLSVTLAGGWIYLNSITQLFHQNERTGAYRLANALSTMAAGPLSADDRSAVHQVAKDALLNDTVLYVAILDRTGQEVATASKGPRGQGAQSIEPEPMTLNYARDGAANTLVVARPIAVPTGEDHHELVGAIRLTLDMNMVDNQLRQAHSRMIILACVMVAAAVPGGYLLVWRVLVYPVRKLMHATHLLAAGDFAARAETPHNDEIGQLAQSFNAMAEQIEAQRQQLLAANEQLEEKVQLRTAELNDANQRLRAEMAEKEDFLRAVSHDLNAPLRNIAGMVTMILMKYRGVLDEEILNRLDRIQANVQTETDLISELLELSRIKTRPQRREATDMVALLTALAGSFEYDLNSRSIDLVIQPEMPTLYVEPNRMRQVFQNLIDNAIKYMPEKPDARIEVTYRRESHEHVFAVSDNGNGIDPEDQQRIFYVFRRATNAASQAPGKGVGLASVKSIVSNYEGRVWVESEPGQGATFFVTLSDSRTELPSEEVDHDSGNDREAQADHHLVGG